MTGRFALRLAVTTALLIAVFTQMDFSSFGAALLQVHFGHLTLAVLFLFAVRFLNAARMVTVARQYDVKLSYGNSISMIFSSGLAGFVLPGGVGTDVVRGLQLSALYKDPRFAAASVIVDRYLGVLAILLVGTCALQFVALPFPWYFNAFVYALLLGGIGFAVFGSAALQLLPRTWREGTTAVARVLGFTQQVLDGLQAGRGRVRLLGVSLIIQVCRCLVFLFTFYAFDLAVPVATVFALVPVLFIFVIAPISLGGLGVREGLLAWLLVPQGFALEPLILVGFASHLLELIASIPGVWFLLRGLREADTTKAV